MIEQIDLKKVATFNELETFSPNKINYLFGGNGTGKTTLGKVINHCESFPECSLTWEASPIETLTYNRDFVERNFSQSDSIKGIFTLGEGSTEAKKEIEIKRKELDNVDEQILKLTDQINKENQNFKGIEGSYIDKAWDLKDQYEEYFKPAYWGHIQKKKSFFEKCLSERNSNSDLLEESEIVKKCSRIFSESLKKYEIIKKPEFLNIINIEKRDILNEKIVGKEDIEIAKLIKRLDNSGWVREGLQYLETTEGTCPFCQQNISESLKSEIEDFFDESYKNKIKELEKIKDDYQTLRNQINKSLDAIVRIDIPIIDTSELKTKKQLFENKSDLNLKLLNEKVRNPSTPISLNSLDQIKAEIFELIDELNKSIKANNKTVENIDQEKDLLKSQIWRFIVEKLKIDIDQFNNTKEKHTKALKGLNSSLTENENKQKELVEAISELESKIVSVQHSVIEINHLLKSFGFTNFELRKASKKGFYELVRDDGSKVEKTLSEGEYTFVTFLYFYHLLQGSIDQSRITKNKIVVIDDPISSLDSSVLFVVSNLIKNITRDAREKMNGIKQVFLLTHNVYFFKEVTFRGNRDNKWKEEAYWLVRKFKNQSRITEYKENPIKTTYELLWRELDEPEKINTATVFNTMRRILEYYFNILGGLDYEEAISKFEGEQKVIFRSLLGWINDGSHFINDDLAVTVDSGDIQKYLNVFKEIFIRMGHESHYKMMTKDNPVTTQTEV